MIGKISRLLQFRLLYVNTDQLVNFHGFYFADKHPLTLALKDPAILKDFYKRYTIENGGYIPAHFENWESTKMCYIPPWGGGKTSNISHKGHVIGPNNEEDIKEILKRLNYVYNQIKQEGYRPFMHPNALIRVCILKKRKQKRYLVTYGQHRASCICFLGYRKILVELQPKGRDWPFNMPRVIDIKDVERWPNVLNGLYTKKDAVRFFEAYFSRDNWERLGL